MTVLPTPVAVPGMGGAAACAPAGSTAEFRGIGASTLPWGARPAAVRPRPDALAASTVAVTGTRSKHDPNVQNFDPTLGIHSPGRPL